MSEISYTHGLISDTAKIVERLIRVVDEREGRVIVDKQELRQILFRMEEILAHYLNQHYIIQVIDMHGMEDTILQPVHEVSEIAAVNLNVLWDSECPICGDQYILKEDADDEDSAVCKVCGFQMKWGWEKNHAKIRHWFQHYAENRGNLVEEFVDPLSPLRMA